jgi:hypothetical protein
MWSAMARQAVAGGEIFGAFSGWRCDVQTRIKYNSESHRL